MAHTVVILGSSGNVGSALIKTLASKHPAIHVLAGVRDVNADKSKALTQAGANVKLVTANLSEPATLAAAIPQGVDAVFVNTPSDINRQQQAINGITAAKNANAKLVVVVSVLSVEHKGIFAEQFGPIEQFAKSAGIPYTLLRLPIFIDNNWGHLQTIKGQGKIYGPNKPEAKFTPIAVQDIGESAAAILAHPAAHHNKTYKLTTKAFNNIEQAQAFTAAVGKQVDYVQVPYEAAKQSILGAGLAEWQVDGILELYHDIDNGESYYAETGDVKALTGHEPTTIEQWTQQVAGAFK